jgi:hypothetical protein
VPEGELPEFFGPSKGNLELFNFAAKATEEQLHTAYGDSQQQVNVDSQQQVNVDNLTKEQKVNVDSLTQEQRARAEQLAAYGFPYAECAASVLQYSSESEALYRLYYQHFNIGVDDSSSAQSDVTMSQVIDEEVIALEAIFGAQFEKRVEPAVLSIHWNVIPNVQGSSSLHIHLSHVIHYPNQVHYSSLNE